MTENASNDLRRAGSTAQRKGGKELGRSGRQFAARSMKSGFETESTWQRDADLEAKVAGQSTKVSV